MEIIGFTSGPLENNCYVVYDKQTGKGAVIDAPLDSYSKILGLIIEHKITIEAIILTHYHWDHIAHAEELRRQTHAPVYIHTDDEDKIKEPMKYTIFPLPFTIESVSLTKLINHNDVLNTGKLSFEIYHTPGHTEGSVILVERNNKVVFSGDLIFNGSVGRTDFPGGSYESLMNSINNYILTLPDDFRILSGHGPETTVGWEKANNPFLNKGYI